MQATSRVIEASVAFHTERQYDALAPSIFAAMSDLLTSSPPPEPAPTPGGVHLSATGDLAITGEVVGRDKIIQNIQHIYERALSAVEEAEQAQAAEAKRLAQGVSALAQRLQVHAGAEAIAGRNPYQGLLAYRLSDADLFFGRERAITELLEQLTRGPLTVVHSESGAGKSSLLQAGISPRLITAGHLPLYLRPYNAEPAYAIKRAFLSDLSQTPLLATAPLREFLRQVSDVLGPKRSLYLLVDQFEEFFTLLSEPERGEFIRELAECLDDESLAGRVRWVLSLRTEYFGNLATFRPRIRNPFENDFRLSPLSHAEAHDVITRPAALRGITYEAGLVEAIIHDLGAHQIAPPQMQLVCSALFEELEPGETHLTLALYNREGCAAGILRGHLERVLSRDLPGNLRVAARRLLESLISSEQQRIVRSRRELAAELAAKGVTPETLDVILNQLVDSRLLRTDEDDDNGEVVYELSHDYLLSEIKLDPDVQARKAAQELLEQEARAYRRYKTLLTADRLKVVEPYLSELSLTPEVQQLIEASRAEVERDQREREAHRQQMLEDAQKLAESEARRAADQAQAAQRLQARNRLVTGVGVVAGLLAIIAFALFGQTNAALQEADAQRNIALTQQAFAITEQARAEEAAALAASEAQRAEAEAARAEAEARQARLGLSSQLAVQAQAVLKEGFPQASLLLAVEALSVTRAAGDPPVPLAEEALQRAAFKFNTRGLGQMWTDLGQYAVELSQDRRWLAVAGIRGWPVRVYDLGADDPEATALTLPVTDSDLYLTVNFTADHRWLVGVSSDGSETLTVRAWNLATPEMPALTLGTLSDRLEPPRAFTLSPDGAWVLVAGETPTLANLAGDEPVLWPLRDTLPPLESELGYVFSADSRWLLSTRARVFSDASFRLWDLSARDPAGPVASADRAGLVRGTIRLSPDSRWLVSSYLDEVNGEAYVELFDLQARGVPSLTLQQGTALISTLEFTERWLVGVQTESLLLWDLTQADVSAAPPLELASDLAGATVRTYTLSPQGRWLAVLFSRDADEIGQEEGLVYLVDLQADDPTAASFVAPYEGAVDLSSRGVTGETVLQPVYGFTFSDDERWLIATGEGENHLLFDLTAANPFSTSVPLSSPPIFAKAPENLSGPIVFSPDGRWMAAPRDSNTSALWSLEALSESPAELPPQSVFGDFRLFSPDGEWMLLTELSGAAKLYHLASGFEVAVSGIEAGVGRAEFSADARRLILLGIDGEVRWLDLERAHVGHTLAGLSGDGNQLVTLQANRVYVRDLSDSETDAVRRFESPATALALAAAVSPDNRWLAMVDADGVTALWDLATLEAEPVTRLIPLEREAAEVWSARAAFSADGRWLAVGDTAGLTVWDVSGLTSGDFSEPTAIMSLVGDYQFEAITPDGRWLFASAVAPQPDGSGRVSLAAFDLAAPDPQQPIFLPAASSPSAISSDSRWLATLDDEQFGTLVWDLASLSDRAEPAFTIPVLTHAFSFSPEARWLAVSGSAETGSAIYVIDLNDPSAPPRSVTRETVNIGAIVMADSGYLITFEPGVAALWDLAADALAPFAQLKGFNVPYSPYLGNYRYTVSPDGRWLTFFDGGQLQLWDLTDTSYEDRIIGELSGDVSPQFTADSHWLIVTGSDRPRLVNLYLDEVLAEACALAGRNLTPGEWARYVPGQDYRRTCPNWP